MPYLDLPDVSLYYEVSGPAHGDALVMIHGLGAQMIAWYPGFCSELEGRGFRLVRFDNRDVGLSSKLSDDEPYTIHDMVNDVAGLMDHLGLTRAHIAGQSMGGMIAQQFAISNPERVLSLCSIYSTPSMEFRVDDEEAARVRSEPAAADREAAIAQYIKRERISGLDDLSEEWIQQFAAEVVDRSWCPEGADRQARAMTAAPDRREGLRSLRIPTTVIHGRNDRLVSFEGGVATALAVPGAELHVFADMGHQVVPHLWQDIATAIRRNADRAAVA